jgi:hypothetical protein
LGLETTAHAFGDERFFLCLLFLPAIAIDFQKLNIEMLSGKICYSSELEIVRSYIAIT